MECLYRIYDKLFYRKIAGKLNTSDIELALYLTTISFKQTCKLCLLPITEMFLFLKAQTV